MIHQHFKLVDVHSVAENIVLGNKSNGFFIKKGLKEKVREISVKFGLEIDPDKKIYNMSVSEKQTVEILKVLYRGADILILDEPTAGLDPSGREEILQNIENYRKAKNATIMMVSHSMNDVARLTDRLIVMNKARKAMDGTPTEIYERPVEDYVGEGEDRPGEGKHF